MNKKSLFLTLTALCLTGLMFAQPILTNNVLPDVGESTTLLEVDATNVTEGSAGANQTWNFANFVPTAGTDPIVTIYTTPAGTPYAAQFPGANLVGYQPGDTVTYGYYKEEPGQFSFFGAASLDFLLKNTDPDINLKFPFNFGNTYTDNFSGTTVANGLTIYRQGTRTDTYDGYGTLITPKGTFNNAIRIKTVNNTVDSLDQGFAYVVITTNLTTYAWFAANQHGSLAQINYTDGETKFVFAGQPPQITPTPLSKFANYLSVVTTAAHEAGPSLEMSIESLSPNPTTDYLNIRFAGKPGQADLQLSMTDAGGRILQTQLLGNTVSEQITLSVAHLPAGLYFLSLTDGKARQTLAWQKQ